MNNNCPTLRFPQYSEKWDNTILGKVSSFSKGKGLSKNDMSSDGKILCIRYGELYTHYTEVIKDVISRTNVSSDELVFSEANDIIIPSSGETPEDIATASCIIDSGIAIGGDLNIIKTNNNGIFISYYLNNKRKYQIANLSQGKSVVHLYADQLYTLEINIPSLPEQQKIASFLTTVDEKLQALKKKKTLLEQYKKGIMQKIFSQEIRFRDDNGKEFPEWNKSALGDVLNKNSIKNKKCNYTLVQSVSNKHGFVNQDEYFEDRVIASKDLSGYYVITKGTFAYNPSRIDVGSLAYKKDDAISVVSPLYVSFRTKENISDLYLLNWFFSEGFIKQMNSSFEGSVRHTLSYDALSKIIVFYPTIAEQNRIVNFLSAIDDKINHCQTQIEKAELWKKGLLQRMFC